MPEKKNPARVTLRSLKERIEALEQTVAGIQGTLAKWSLKNLLPESEIKDA